MSSIYPMLSVSCLVIIAQSPVYCLPCPVSSVQFPFSSIWCPVSNLVSYPNNSASRSRSKVPAQLRGPRCQSTGPRSDLSGFSTDINKLLRCFIWNLTNFVWNSLYIIITASIIQSLTHQVTTKSLSLPIKTYWGICRSAFQAGLGPQALTIQWIPPIWWCTASRFSESLARPVSYYGLACLPSSSRKKNEE